MPIFISYSSKDRKSAEAICAAIENRGFACWISSRDIGPGENFQSQIVGAIRSARVMVLVFSGNANNSEEIKKELVLAGQSNLVVIPVRVEDVAPGDAFAYELATRQWIDVFGDWEQAIQRVIQQIENVTKAESAPQQAPTAGIDATSSTAPPAAPAVAGATANMGRPQRGPWLIAAACAAAVILAAGGWLAFGGGAWSFGNRGAAQAAAPVSSSTSPVLPSSKITPIEDAFSKGADAVKGRQ
ncbi:MAG TPA: toll/interleukin-1 receptor domain-containing protein [Stellaceae bacterium]|nr:toll/interleukin-1 receptor domain-containing protein [Stellaceae bacterium]